MTTEKNQIHKKASELANELDDLENRIKALEDQITVPRDRPERIILYPAGSDPNAFRFTGGGATNIYDNVVTKGVWTWDQVRQYEYCTYSDLQFSGPFFRKELKDKVKAVRAAVPSLKILAYIRHDLWWFFREFKEGVPENPDRLWGTIVGKPTVNMGQVVDDAREWSEAQTQIQQAGYNQEPTNADLSNDGTLLTLPYEITLDASKRLWHTRNNTMRANDENWLDLLTDNLAKQFKYCEVDGFYIQPQKIQMYVNSAPHQLHEWLEGTENRNWDLATDSGGPEGSWSKRPGKPPRLRQVYDDRSKEDNVLEVVEGTEKLLCMLREKIPRAFLVYSPFFFRINAFRSSGYRTNFRVSYVAKYGGTHDEADQHWADIISRCASIADAIEFAADDNNQDFAQPWANNLRGLDHWILRPSRPQDISLPTNN